LKVGVLLDEPEVIPGFDYTFFEAKPSSGRVLPALPKAWNVVNCFADNTISRQKPGLVATRKGERAVRGTPRRFLWDWICPSRTGYRDYCIQVIQKIEKQDVAGIRLDSVCFPREGYCDCDICVESWKKSGQEFTQWRANQITSFIHDARRNLDCALGLTLEPDPCCGKERFGLDLAEITKYVDFISTPLYMDYSIVYWLDIIANCFRRRITKPYFIELYAGHPRAPVKNIVSALAVASEYADAIILSTYQEALTKDLQRQIVDDASTWKFFEERGCEAMLDVLKAWRKLL